MPKATAAPPPPFRPNYTAQIRAMRKGATEFFPGANHETFKSMCSRLSKDMGRTYMTSKRIEDGAPGVRVWRTV